MLKKRPESLTVALTNASGTPIKLRKYDEAVGEWTDSGEDAKLTLTAANADSSDPNKWVGSIGPLVIADYSDESRYMLRENIGGGDPLITEDYYRDGDPVISIADNAGLSGNPSISASLFSSSFTNVLNMPMVINLNWDDQDNADDLRPEKIDVRLIGSDGQVLKKANGEEAEFTLNAQNGWKVSALMAPFDVNSMKIISDTVEGYTRLNLKHNIDNGNIKFDVTYQHVSDKDSPETTVSPQTSAEPGDQLANIPETGDKSHVFVWMTLAFLSIMGLVIILVVSHQKHRR
ncbi:MAG: Cna B-type domain-containing protein [Clostridia bacterium]|nr:Cna B-type domain-containing protein [Clostridia bacterium]